MRFFGRERNGVVENGCKQCSAAALAYTFVAQYGVWHNVHASEQASNRLCTARQLVCTSSVLKQLPAHSRRTVEASSSVVCVATLLPPCTHPPWCSLQPMAQPALTSKYCRESCCPSHHHSISFIFQHQLQGLRLLAC